MSNKNFVVKTGLAAGSLVLDSATSSINTTDSGALQSKINLDIITGATGSAIIPVGTELQRDSIPTVGYLRFNTTSASFEGYDGSAWGAIGGGGGGGIADPSGGLFENSNTIVDSYTVTTGKNAMSAGPITVDPSAVITVPAGSRWAIV